MSDGVHERKAMFGRRLYNRQRGIRNEDIVRPAIGDIDIIEAHAEVGYQP